MRVAASLQRGLWRAARAALLGAVAALPLAGLPADLRVSEAGANAWSTAFHDADEIIHYSFAFKPGNPAVVYAGGSSNLPATRIYKSADSGKTWGFTSTPEYGGPIYDIEIPKKEPATVYIGAVFGAWKSTDDGNSWSKASTGLPPYAEGSSLTTSVVDLAVDPDNPNVLYAGTATDGVYKSTNGGAAWAKLMGPVAGKYVNVVKVDPSRPTTVYASASDDQATAVYRSRDGGATWSHVETGSSDFVSAIAIHPTDSSRLYLGMNLGIDAGRVLRSTDGGVSWASSSLASGVRSLAVHPGMQNTIWATTTVAGVFRSADGGANWTGVTSGLTPPATVVPTQPADTANPPVLSSPASGTTLQTATLPTLSFRLPGDHTANIVVIRPAFENSQFYSSLVSRSANVRVALTPSSPVKLFPGTTYAWQVRSSTTMPVSCAGTNSVPTVCANDPAWQATSKWFTFKTPGTPAVFTEAVAINPEAANVVWLAAHSGLQSYTDLSIPVAPPSLVGPAQGAVLTGLGATLTWTNPPGAAQYQIQVMPANNDGPAFNLIRNADTSFTVQPPVFGAGPYEMLPGMTYTWRVRITTAVKPLTENAPEWGPWTEPRTFRTPVRDSSKLTAATPADGATVNAGPQILQWANGDKDVFYYEVQVSGDTRFDTDPATATSFVWWNLVHGGVTNPLNSYQTPPLEAGQTVYWRVRPRVQGDGAPVAWGPVWKFTTKAP